MENTAKKVFYFFFYILVTAEKYYFGEVLSVSYKLWNDWCSKASKTQNHWLYGSIFFHLCPNKPLPGWLLHQLSTCFCSRFLPCNKPTESQYGQKWSIWSNPYKNRSKTVKNGNKTVKTVMVLGRSTMVLGRSTRVLGRSTISVSQNTHIRTYKPQLLVSMRFNKMNNLK